MDLKSSSKVFFNRTYLLIEIEIPNKICSSKEHCKTLTGLVPILQIVTCEFHLIVVFPIWVSTSNILCYGGIASMGECLICILVCMCANRFVCQTILLVYH